LKKFCSGGHGGGRMGKRRRGREQTYIRRYAQANNNQGG